MSFFWRSYWGFCFWFNALGVVQFFWLKNDAQYHVFEYLLEHGTLFVCMAWVGLISLAAALVCSMLVKSMRRYAFIGFFWFLTVLCGGFLSAAPIFVDVNWNEV